MASRRGPLVRGERAPDFVLPGDDGQRARFYGFVGGAPSLLVLTGDGRRGDPPRLLAALVRELDDDTVVHVVAGPGLSVAGAFRDGDGGLHATYGFPLDEGPRVLVLDANVRVADVLEDESADRLATAARSAVAALLGDDAPASRAPRHAPVLLVPDALEPPLREELIERCATHGTVETGVETTAGTERVERADERRKRRRDHTVEDPDLLRRLSSHVGRRVMPELAKAFAYRATRFEGFKLGCYEADEQGFFAAHRDNLSSSTAHRRFALTLNLNEDYDGGELRFPEYGPALYRPDAGEALVFSGSHLHEVLPVTRGRRFVLLSFLFGDEHPTRRR